MKARLFCILREQLQAAAAMKKLHALLTRTNSDNVRQSSDVPYRFPPATPSSSGLPAHNPPQQVHHSPQQADRREPSAAPQQSQASPRRLRYTEATLLEQAPEEQYSQPPGYSGRSQSIRPQFEQTAITQPPLVQPAPPSSQQAPPLLRTSDSVS